MRQNVRTPSARLQEDLLRSNGEQEGEEFELDRNIAELDQTLNEMHQFIEGVLSSSVSQKD